MSTVALEGTVLSPPKLTFHPAIPSKTHSHAFKGLLSHGPFDSSRVSVTEGSILLMFPPNAKELAMRLQAALLQGHKGYPGFAKLFRTAVPPSAVSHFSFETSHQPLGEQYRGGVEQWNARNTQPLPELALVIVPHSDRWETEQPYYQAKAAFARLGIPSQMVTSELLEDQRQFDWSVANIALASFAKLGGIPWLVSASGYPTSDLVVGVGRSDIRSPSGTSRIFGYAVSFVANGLYRHTWSFTPTADEDTYSARLEEAVTAALQQDLDTDQPAERIVIHLGRRTGWREIEAASRALASSGSKVEVAFLRIDDTTIFDLADKREDTLAPPKGLAVELTERRYLLQAEGLTPVGAPSGPLLIELDERSSVSASELPSLVGQAFNLSHANWRGFNAKSEPAPLAYGELLARLVGYMEMVSTWDTNLLRSDLQARPWFL